MTLAVRALTTCKSCHAEMVWCVSTNGHRMPVDPEPVPDGNLIVVGTGRAPNGDVLDRVLVLGKGDVPLGDPPRFQSHFVTCPDARGWRRS